MELSPRCPAAEPLSGPPVGGPSIICKAMDEEARSTDQIVEGITQGRHKTMRSDPSTVESLCCGAFRACPVWQLAEARDRARSGRLLPRVEPDPNSIYPFHRPPASGGPRAPEEGFDDPSVPREWADAASS